MQTVLAAKVFTNFCEFQQTKKVSGLHKAFVYQKKSCKIISLAKFLGSEFIFNTFGIGWIPCGDIHCY